MRSGLLDHFLDLDSGFAVLVSKSEILGRQKNILIHYGNTLIFNLPE